jgi:hypothetical protein
MEKPVQLGVPVDRTLNDTINKLAPRGMKAEAIRKLLELLIETQREWVDIGRTDFVVDYLLRDQCKLVLRNGK